MRNRLTWMTLAAVLSLSACEDDGAPYVPPVETPTDVSFAADVQPILTASCATAPCHAGTTPSAGMDLSAGNARAALIGVNSPNYGIVRVVPGNSAQSLLWLKLSDDPPGAAMPLTGSITEQERLTIRAWIDEGALDN